MLIDITPTITSETHVWPGDTPLTREVLMEIDRGDSVTLSTLRATVHLGAHADAPSHYGQGGRTMEEQPLELYVGPCQVMHVAAQRGRRISIDDLPGRPNEERLLIRTGTFPSFENWNTDFAGLEPDLVDHLHQAGVRLVGTDAPSVDLAEDKEILAHKRFFANDMAILEGLKLDEVAPGRYELIALPLKIGGFDGSPVRAILRTLDS